MKGINQKIVKQKNGFLLLIFVLLTAACTEKNTTLIESAGIVDGDVVSVKTQVVGTVKEVRFKDGVEVAAGDVLVEVDREKLLKNLEALDISGREIQISRVRLRQQLDFLKENIAYLTKQTERLRRLNQNAAVSGDKLEAAELRLLEVQTTQKDIQQQLSGLSVKRDALRNQGEQLDLQINDFIIVSPVSGIVLERFVVQGEKVFPGSIIADILDLSSLYVEAFLELEEIGGLKLGQKVKLKVDGLDRSFEGTISYFGKKAEFSPRYIISEEERKELLFQVKVAVPEEDVLTFKLGMPVTVIFRE
ncbi:HlyD family secretion protein [Acidobacteriota bacterium]